MKKRLAPAEIRAFRERIRRHYREKGRRLPWRAARDPYRVLVSEVMLQQTQAERVTRHYGGFIAAFPDFKTLARAPLRAVLAAWQGLGYNRRALSLREAARRVVGEFGGRLPASPELLARLPGIGPATAASISVFAFDNPVPFIETNIRAVFLHCFFPRRRAVRDEDLLPLVRCTMDRARPREWCNALMDYGAMLKGRLVNPGRRSAHHRRQPPFRGSARQLRGRIIRTLLPGEALTAKSISERLAAAPDRARRCLEALERDGLVRKRGRRYSVA